MTKYSDEIEALLGMLAIIAFGFVMWLVVMVVTGFFGRLMYEAFLKGWRAWG